MKRYQQLLLQNRAWVELKLEEDGEFFHRLANIQTPDFLWIGCSDSRVPADQITGTNPGEIFVHRNISNLVVHTDLNLLSVLQYAVDVLKVKDVIVCGHYGCGGVKAAMSHHELGIINKWLRNIKDVYRHHQEELEAIADEDKRADRLTELNVEEQVQNLIKTSIIQKAWKQHNRPTLHGWIYRVDDGHLHQLSQIEPNSPIDPIYRYDLD